MLVCISTKHVEAHKVGVMSKPHSESDDEKRNFSDFWREGGRDSGKKQQHVNYHQRLKTNIEKIGS